MRAVELWLPAVFQRNFTGSELKIWSGEKTEIFHNPGAKFEHEKSENPGNSEKSGQKSEGLLYAIVKIRPEIENCADGKLSVEFRPKFADCHLAKRYMRLWTRNGPFAHFVLTEPPKRSEVFLDRKKRSISENSGNSIPGNSLKETNSISANSLKAKRSIPENSENGKSSFPAWNRNQKENSQLPIKKCEEMWTSGALESLDSQPFVSSSFAPCCQRQITVNLTELGWENWIKSPATFTTNYCIGRCTNFGTFNNLAHGIYAQIMEFLPEIQELGKKPCCTPVKFSPLLVTVENGDELVTQRLNDAIVDQCGCL